MVGKRPFVEFDVNNKKHRKYFARFLQTGSWVDCPVQFVNTDHSGEHLSVMMSKIARFYCKREFGGVVK